MSSRTILPPALFTLPKRSILVVGLPPPPADVAAGEAAIMAEARARHVAREAASDTVPARKAA